MSVISDIGRDLHALVRIWSADGMQAFSAEVLSVDVATRSCSVRSISSETEMEYPEVWLMPEKVDGILYVPKVGSTVIVENNANLQPYIGMWSKIDQILYVVGGSTIKMLPSGIELDGDSFGGLLKVTPSVQAWNDLQTDINNLKVIFAALAAAAPTTFTTAPGLQDAFAAAFAAAIASYSAAPLTPTTAAMVENTKVQHGAGS
jgi:hypothetical protein